MVARYSFTAEIARSAEYSAVVLRALGEGYERPLVRAAVAEALLNAIAYGALGVQRIEDGDPLEFLERVREAEARTAPNTPTVEVEVHVAPTEATVTIADPGAGFDWRAAARAEPSDPTRLATRGRGLAIMRGAAAAVSWNPRGNAVSLRFLRESGARPPTTPNPSVERTGRTSRALGTADQRLAVAAARSRRGPGDDRTVQLGEVARDAQRYAILGSSAAGVVWRNLPTGGIVLLGRGDDVDVRLDDNSVSRRHAAIVCGDPPLIEDLGSTNGTRMEGRRLAPGERCAMPIGSVVQLGSATLLLQSGHDAVHDVARQDGDESYAATSLEDAAALVSALLAAPRIEHHGVTIESTAIPTRKIGGDVVDFIDLDKRWSVFLIDVAGHGLGAALTATAVRALLRDRLTAGATLVDAYRALNASLLGDFDKIEHHAAVAGVLVDERRGVIEILNAGCPPLALVVRGGERRAIRSAQPPAGLVNLDSASATLLGADDVEALVMASDGMTEAFGGTSNTSGLLDALGLVDGAEPTFPREEIERRILAQGDERDDATLVRILFPDGFGPATERTAP